MLGAVSLFMFIVWPNKTKLNYVLASHSGTNCSNFRFIWQLCCICNSQVSSKNSLPCSLKKHANVHASVLSTFNTSGLSLQTRFRCLWAHFTYIWPFGLFFVCWSGQLHVCLAFFFRFAFAVDFIFLFVLFSIVPLNCFFNRIAHGVINIDTDIVDKLNVFQICPSSGDTASSKHSLANPSSSLCRLSACWGDIIWA